MIFKEEFKEKALIQKSNNVDLYTIIDRYGTNYGECIRTNDYGGQNIEQATINLIVSDGDRNKVYRIIIQSYL